MKRWLPCFSLWAGLAALTLAAAALGGCTTNPATGGQSFTAFMSQEKELEVGRDEHPKILKQFGGELDDPKLRAYVDGIGQRLARQSELPDLKFTFTVLNSDITNAFALPGGYVYVTRGLLSLASNEAELAGVIGHEIGHVTARHTAQRYSRAVATGIAATAVGVLESVFLGTNVIGQVGAQAGQLYIASYSRDQEFEADTLGVRYLARSDYAPNAMSTFLAKLQAESALAAELAGKPGSTNDTNIMATHPRTQDRVREAIAAAREQGEVGPDARVGREEFLSAIDGMAYGGDRKSGFIRNRTFIHPSLRFQFEVPTGFQLVNSDRNVVARGPNQATIIFDRETRPQVAGVAMANYLTAVWGRNVRLQNVERLTINELEAATGVTRLQGNGAVRDIRLIAIRFDPSTIYRFMFVTQPADTASLSEPLRRTTYSFRKLSEADAARATPLRVRFVTVGASDTVASLARRMAFDTAQEQRFRVLNGLQPDEALRPGDRVKIITD
ncbi:MAG TPA: M48 family metalloprotease [Alphaproteobacteria bacterium]|nr:M48 family metalloprotease [Alphaproteobacteria bacterium]